MIGSLRARFDRLLRRARPAADGIARLGSRQIYILPTKAGTAFGFLLVALLFAAINYGNNLIFALTFLLAGVGHAALLQTWRNLYGLSLEARAAEPVFAGQTLAFPIKVASNGGRARDALNLEFPNQPSTLADLSSPPAAWVDLSHRTENRGRLKPDRILVSTRYPLGLFRAWSIVEPGVETLVYPRPLEGFPLPGFVEVQDAGAERGKEGQEDFAGLRGYRPGDSPQKISWKAMARTDELHAKTFDGEATTLVWLDWDLAPADNTEEKLRILSAWVNRTAQDDAPWGMRLPGVNLEPASGETHRLRCLEALASFGETR